MFARFRTAASGALLAVIGYCVFAASAPADELSIGDQAPPLSVSKWVKGDEIQELDPKKLYVVEFWATWCGPCKISIPHLTELQKEHKDVTFIGVSIWEDDQSGVEPFVKEMGDQMDYHVATDQVPEGKEAEKGAMASAWMDAAGENGIPTAFVVQDGKIAWIGHPMRIEEPLKKIVAGDWDLNKAASERKEAKATQKKLQELSSKLQETLGGRKFADAIKILDEAFQDQPALEAQLGTLKYGLLLETGKADQASEYGTSLVEGSLKDNASALNDLAWGIVDPDNSLKDDQRDVKLALKAAKRASELTENENPSILDTLALAYFQSGDAARALETQEKAVKLAGDDGDDGMRDRLEQYREAGKKGEK